jgi:hypothetical protein
MKWKIIIPVLLCCLTVTPAMAQDANYWQSNYGACGMLTPGSALANDNGKGFFYYNPALLAINPKTSVSLSSSVYQYESVKIKDGVGPGLNLRSRNLKINPQMAAGTIAFKKKKTFAFGYALIHDPVISYQTTQRQDKQMQVLDDSYSPGQEYYIGQYLAHNKINMTSAILSGAVKLNNKWSVGLMAEGRLRSQDFFQDINSRAYANPTDPTVLPELVNVETSYELTYLHMGLRFKLGAARESGRHHWGFLLTTPMLTLWGRGSLSSDIIVNNLRYPPSFTKTNLLANGQQNGLKAKYKEPASLAISYAYDYGYGQLSITAEYFEPVNFYNIITPRNESFIRPDNPDNRAYTADILKFSDERKQVLNIGIGASYFINPELTAFLSLQTDHTYAYSEDINGFYPYVTNFNTYHAQVGGNFKRKKLNLRAGFLLSYGTSPNYLQPVNFGNPNEDTLMLGDAQQVRGDILFSWFFAGLYS